jgi:predicted transposase/invertase (TIGR01784 family)
MQRFLDPKNDFAFKRVFGTEKNKEILIGFLNDIFAGTHDQIEDVEFLKLDQDPEIAALRQSIVDVMCRDVNGKRFIIEMQCAYDTHFIRRAVAYACRAYLNQRTKKDVKPKTDRSAGYGDMKPVIFLAILDHKLFPDKKEYLSHHKVSDVCTGENDIKYLSFSFLELGKFKKEFSELRSNIEKWTYFFKHAPSAEPRELEEIRKRDRIIGNAYDALSQSAFTPEELLEYERYEMKEDEINTRISDAEEEGVKKGIEKGEQKKARETALNAIAMGLSTKQIMQLTGLSEEELKELR